MNEPVLFIYRKEGGRQSEQSKKFEIRIHVAGGTESQRGKEQTGIIETVTMKAPEELVPMLCYEDIEQTSVEWLWFPYLPFGKLTIIQGNPSESGQTFNH